MYRMTKTSEMKDFAPELLSEEEKLHMNQSSGFFKRNLRSVVACTFLGTCLAMVVVLPMVSTTTSSVRGNAAGHVYMDKAVDIDGNEFAMGDRFKGQFLYITNTASF